MSDYLTRAEAAEYCKVSLTQFQRLVERCAIPVGRPAGKPLYRREDLRRALESNWQGDLPRNERGGVSLGNYQRETRRLSKLLRSSDAKEPGEVGEVVPLPERK